MDNQTNIEEKTNTLNNLARIAKLYRAYAAAIDYYQQALDVSDDKNHPVILYNLANVYKAIDDYKNAEQLYKNVAILSKNKGDTSRYLKSMVQLGMVQHKQQNRLESLKTLNQVVDFPTDVKLKKYIAKALQGKSDIAYENNQVKDAIQLLERALPLHMDDANRFVTLLDLGAYSLEQQQLQKAVDYLLQAEKIYSHANPNSEYARVFDLLYQVMRRTGKTELAFSYSEKHRSELETHIRLQKEISTQLNTRSFYQILESYRKAKQSRDEMFLISLIIGCLVLLIIAILLLHQWKNAQKRKAIVKSFERLNVS